MSFTSVKYLFFLAVALAVCRSLPAKIVPFGILLFSVAFYSLWDARALIPLFAVTVVAYAAGLYLERMDDGPARGIVAYGSVTFVVAALLLLKELPKSMRPLDWIAPLGISYYTFKLVSYLLDLNWRKYPAQRDPVVFASYSTFFPQIVAGPIQRADHYFGELRSVQPLTRVLLWRGIARIALGLFKKLVIADHIGIVLNSLYAQPREYSGAPLLLAFYLFPIQLYTDFSGLADIAIGSALLLGIGSPENFNRPFSASSISEYWRRWHMSLTSWTTDYIFTPLRMATRAWNRAGLLLSIFLNMMWVALWHGITWNFAVFGVLHSAFVSADLLTVKKRKSFFKRHAAYERWAGWLGCILTFHLVALGMVLFRARNLGDAAWIVGHLGAPLATFSSQLAGLTTMAGWRDLELGVTAFVLMGLLLKCVRTIPSSWNVQLAPRWMRWSFYGVSTLALGVGFLLLFVHGSAREPFLYEIF